MAIPKPSGTKATQSERPPFLKAKDIGKVNCKPVSLTLIGGATAIRGQFGEQLSIPVTLKGKRYDWTSGNGINGGNHRRLYDRFGGNDKKWRGVVRVTVKDWNGNLYVAVAD